MARSAQFSRPNHAKSQNPNAAAKKSDAFILRLKVAGFKPHPSPYEGTKVQQFSFKILADQELRETFNDEFFDNWTDVNPREQKLDGHVMRDVERTWNDYPEEFFRINRGMVLSAESVTYDNESGLATIRLETRRKHGGLDGIHTIRKIVKDLIPNPTPDAEVDDDDATDYVTDEEDSAVEDASKVDRYVSCEVWVGLNLEEVTRMSQGRNTSRNVPLYGIMSVRGDFGTLEKAIRSKNPRYFEKVAFKPNQHIEGLEEFCPVSVLEILQLMMAMDITNYQENNHPIEAYKNRAFGPEYFAPMHDKDGREINKRSRRSEYDQMLPLIGDFLALYDKLRQVVPGAYDAAKSTPRYWTRVIAGKKGKVNAKQVEPLYYLDHTGATKTLTSPTSLFFPMFSAFRAHLKKENGQYQWLDGQAPTTWPDDEFFHVCQRMARKIAMAAGDTSSLHDVARDEKVWDICFETLNSDLMKSGRKKK